MNNESNTDFESRIRAAVGTAPAPDFETWQRKNVDALRSLDESNNSDFDENVVAKSNGQKMDRVSSTVVNHGNRWRLSLLAMVTLAMIAFTAWTMVPGQPAFGKAIQGINLAQTITWVRTSYQRITSEDGERFWLQSQRHEVTYMEPGYYRYDDYDHTGKLVRTCIDDPVKHQRLTLNLERKTFELEDHQDHKSPRQARKSVEGKAKLNVGPFAWFNRAIQEGGQWVGQHEVDGRKVHVMRWQNLMMGIHNPRNVGDVWIDAETEQLVGVSHPGSSVFDPETLEYRNNKAEEKCSGGRILGSITKDIVLDAEVDPSVFEFKIPEGFAEAPPEMPRAAITEIELIQWLEVLAKVNDNQFVDGFVVRDTKKISEASHKPVEEKTEDERRMGELRMRHFRNGNTMPFWDFIETNTVMGDYKYLGKGVRLGTEDRVILLYRLKETGQFRALHGDLRIENVTEDDAKLIKEGA